MRTVGSACVGAEEDAAFSLIQSLEGGVRTPAVIADRSLGDIVSGPGRELSLQRFEGVPLARLNEAQRGGVMRILELYAGTMRDEIAGPALAKVREAGDRDAALRLGGQPCARPAALLPRAGAHGAGRVRQHAGRRQPRAFDLDRSAWACSAATSSRRTTRGRIDPCRYKKSRHVASCRRRGCPSGRSRKQAGTHARLNHRRQHGVLIPPAGMTWMAATASARSRPWCAPRGPRHRRAERPAVGPRPAERPSCRRRRYRSWPARSPWAGGR